MRLQFQKRSALKLASRIIPEAQRNRISDTNHFVMPDLIRHPEILRHVQLVKM